MVGNAKAAPTSKACTPEETASKSQSNGNSSLVTFQEHSDNSAASQRERILTHLRSKGSLTTLQARHCLDVMHPAMRVCELRKEGYPIETVWVSDLTPEGRIHRVGKYRIKSTLAPSTNEPKKA